MSNNCLLAYILPTVAPAIALLYIICVWGTYAYMKDYPWTAKLGRISLRLGVLVGATASSIGMCEASSNANNETLPTSAIVFVGLLFTSISAYFIYHTRVHDVVGSLPPRWNAKWMQGKVVLITGANTGIGKETAAQLASMGATVIMACRSQARAEKAMEDIRRSSKVFLKENQLLFLPLDLGDFQSIRQAVKKLEELKLGSLDVLINNAGVMMGTKTMSKDGIELMMQANHLGHFLLTNLLLPKLEQHNSRVLTLSSSTHRFAHEGFDFDDMVCDNTRKYTLFGQYAMTKLANILFTKELARRHDKIWAVAVHPGIVRTDVTRNMPWYLRYPNLMFAYCVVTLQKTPSEGAYCSVYCAASDKPPKSGSYVANCAEEAPVQCAESLEVCMCVLIVAYRVCFLGLTPCVSTVLCFRTPSGFGR
jgi:NAD(P)-dependent dehydrogenase (short-subunit alcohol dehydrogenase family)